MEGENGQNEMDPPEGDMGDQEMDKLVKSESSTSEKYQGIAFNKAISKTVYYQKGEESRPFLAACCCGCIFQVIVIILFIVVNQSVAPLTVGLSFLQSEPPRYECFND